MVASCLGTNKGALVARVKVERHNRILRIHLNNLHDSRVKGSSEHDLYMI